MRGLIHHLDLTVTIMQRSIRFYDLVLSELGYKRERAYEGDVPVWMYENNVGIVFSIGLHLSKENSTHDRYKPGLHHLAFSAESANEIDDFYEFLNKNEVEILDPPAKYDYTPGYYAVFFKDPDGLKLEVAYEPKI